MSYRCLVVADSARARIFVAAGNGSARLTQRMEVVNGDVATPESKAPLETRFAAEVAQAVTDIVQGWQRGSVVLAASSATLGLLRKPIQDRLPAGVALNALARDYTALTLPSSSGASTWAEPLRFLQP
jgi:protein required for attachment to host cells